MEVTSTLADGYYGPGHEVEILIKYTAPVVVYGVPRLRLDLGDADDYASFEALRDGTNNTLVFVYVVREGARASCRCGGYVLVSVFTCVWKLCLFNIVRLHCCQETMPLADLSQYQILSSVSSISNPPLSLG